MCKSCDRLKADGVSIPDNTPQHTDVFLEGSVPVFQKPEEYVAWVKGRFVHAAFGGSKFNGTSLFDGNIFHMNSQIS